MLEHRSRHLPLRSKMATLSAAASSLRGPGHRLYHAPVEQGKIVALEALRTTLGTGFSVRYCRSLPDDYDTFAFLNAIYQSYLSMDSATESNPLRRWIERTAQSAPKLTLIYYEASRHSLVQTIEEIEPVWQPQATRHDRIRLHRTVVDHYRDRSR